jgi:hypothetical protein
MIRTMRVTTTRGRQVDNLIALRAKLLQFIYSKVVLRSTSGRRLSATLVIQSETRWIRDSLGPNMTHLGNNLKPAANQYPKGFMVKDSARIFSND